MEDLLTMVTALHESMNLFAKILLEAQGTTINPSEVESMMRIYLSYVEKIQDKLDEENERRS